MLVGLRNTPFIYYGEEIGMVDGDIPEGRLQDPARFQSIGRDPERTPMQWDASPGRGFSTSEPWLPYGPADINVAEQDSDPDSMLALYRRAIWLRKHEPSLLRGAYYELPAPAGLFAFQRVQPGSRPVAIYVNTATTGHECDLPAAGTVLLATDRDLDGRRVLGRVEVPALGALWVGWD
jgi:alpha-glucosidase